MIDYAELPIDRFAVDIFGNKEQTFDPDNVLLVDRVSESAANFQLVREQDGTKNHSSLSAGTQCH